MSQLKLTTDIIATDSETRLAISDATTSLPKPDNIFLLFISALLTVACLAYTYIHLDWNVLEAVKFIGGVALLWGPFAILFFVSVRVSDFAVRLILSLLASYGLTALIYFAMAVLGFDALFPVLQALAVIAVAIYLWRTTKQRPDFRKMLRFRRMNWFLLLIIAASLAVSVPHETPYAIDTQTLSRTALFYPDHLYETALSYELARHTPPLQSTTAGGLPERAYHMFPHMTTMLIARYTDQEDMFRSHLVYHYMVIEVLLCLALYAIGKTFTSTRGAGYVGALSMYLLVMTFPPIVPNPIIGYFYFTAFPLASSGIDPAVYTSPQTYSSMVVTFGVLLGLVLIARNNFKGQVDRNLLFITALLIGASTRFRIQFLLAALPAFLLTMLWLLIRRRKWSYLFAGIIALGVTGLLYLEMTSPVYLSGTAEFHFGLNGLTTSGWTAQLFNSWPFAAQINDWLSHTITNPDTFSAVWQVLSMSLFVTLNVVGIPLAGATIFMFLFTKVFRQEFAIYRLFIVLLIGISMGISLFFSMNYDGYSVPGQTTFQIVWYLMPGGALAMWLIFKQVQRWFRRLPTIVTWGLNDDSGNNKWRNSFRWSRPVIFVFTAIVVVYMQMSPTYLGTSGIQSYIGSIARTITDTQYQSLLYIRANTPPRSIILGRHYLGYGNWSYALSGLTGRAAYMEGDLVSNYETSAYGQNRLDIIRQLWATTSSGSFCSLLRTTPITHIVVYNDDLLHIDIPNTPCITPFWISTDQSAVTFAVQPIPASLYF